MTMKTHADEIAKAFGPELTMPVPVPDIDLPVNHPSGSTIVRRTFTWQEWCQVARKNGPPKPGGEATAWTGHASYSDALNMAEGEGWQSAVADVGDLVRIVSEIVEEKLEGTFKANYDVAGGEVDIARFLDGEPECMVEYQPLKVMRTGRVLKIIIPGSTSAGVDPETIKRRGAAVMALVECFTMMQHTIEVWLNLSAHDASRKNRYAYMVEVQKADQPLDMGRIMFALAHPAMLRQLSFAVSDQENARVRKTFGIGSAYGYPSFAAQLDDADINAENAIILPELNLGHKWDTEYSVKWIQEQLQRIEEMSR